MTTRVAMEAGMSHRERVTWMSLMALVAAYAPYFVWVALNDPTPETTPILTMLARFGAAALGYALLLGIGHLVLHLKWPEDARVSADERDRAIQRRSIQLAYFVLIGGVIIGCAVLPFVADGWKVFNAAIAAIVVAEFVQYAAAAWCYRRG